MIGVVSDGTSARCFALDGVQPSVPSSACSFLLWISTRAGLFLLSCKRMRASLLAGLVPEERKKKERSFWASITSSTFTVLSLCEKSVLSLFFHPLISARSALFLWETLLVVYIAKGVGFLLFI